MSRMGVCEGSVPRMEVWAGSSAASAEASRTRMRAHRDGGLPPSTTRIHLDHPIADKENVDPSGPSNLRCLSSIPSWYPRYPLQDITLLMHFLKGMQLDVDSSVETPSGRSTVVEARKKRSALPVPRSHDSKNNAKSSSSLRMNFR